MTPAQDHGLRRPWTAHAQWRVVEWGFGDGGNFLCAWQAWREDARRPGVLHYTALEPSPVGVDALRPPDEPSGGASYDGLIDELRAQWWGLLPGVHRLSFARGRVLLTVCVGEPLRSLDDVGVADSFVLPFVDMPDRTGGLFKAIARRSRRGTSLWMRGWPAAEDGALRGAGFVAIPRAPQPEFGLPSDLQSCAVFDPQWAARVDALVTPPSRAVVIGGGLAGAAAAASLARRGWSVEVLDAAPEPASGASGLPAGLLAPHTSHDDNLLSRLTRCGVRMTLTQCEMLLESGTDWERTGVLERRSSDARPLPTLGDQQNPWQRASGEEPHAVWHEAGAWVRPGALVRAWLAQPGVRWRGNTQVARLLRQPDGWQVLGADEAVLASSPLVVIAAALGSAPLTDGAIALHAVRGQVSHGDNTGLDLPASPLNGNGHFLPSVPLSPGPRRHWLSGSTYVRGDTALDDRKAEHAANLSRIQELAPEIASQIVPAFAAGSVRGWTGVRCTSSDRRPMVGELQPGLWISTAMGSRGLTFAALCAELMCAQLHAEALPLDGRLARSISVRRQFSA
jgi:tRNA 5-methylaminomethyl-2-thiouridine biosynthesis bifunctional protein